MAEINRNFVAGRMNKVIDERLLPEGEYVNAQNIRMGSTEKSEIGVIENTKGNESLTNIQFQGHFISSSAICIGAYQDSVNETIYWFVHDPSFNSNISTQSGKLDLIVSYNVNTGILTYHIISIWDGVTNSFKTTLNFNPSYIITGVNKIGDLLFFTDDYNQPRCINVNRNYPNPILVGPDYIDGGINGPAIFAESLLVIKKPPTQAPLISGGVTSGQENYMKTRLLCFAYRYRYADGEYSATSQWTEPAFASGPFYFNPDNLLNDGMINEFNQVTIVYNTGSSLVVGIDLLYKSSDNSVIKVIEKLDKQILGIPDNDPSATYVFDNSKIYTILPDYEILRLYDNVPKQAKAQTIMGNRLMYGNYVEGYDLIDINNAPTRINFSSSLVSSTANTISLPSTTNSSNRYYIYTYTGGFGAVIPNSTISIDLSNVQLKYGYELSIIFTFKHNNWIATSPFVTPPQGQTPSTTISFSFKFPRDYTSVYDLANSSEFQNAIGSLSNIQPVLNSSTGNTFTDRFNNSIPSSVNWIASANGQKGYKYYSTFNTFGNDLPDPSLNPQPSLVGQPVNIANLNPSMTTIDLQLLAMVYADYITSGGTATTKYAIEFFTITSFSANLNLNSSSPSLHSNRGYEIGMVYMDEFNRATTALVSGQNTVFIPCSSSINKNEIYVTIPISQRAPYWAKRFKFVCRADSDTYETIYATTAFKDPSDGSFWILLEGENMRKVEIGQVLILKSDTNGVKNTCIEVNILDKQVQGSNFIPGSNAPEGLYIQIKSPDFSPTPNSNLLSPSVQATSTAFDTSSAVINITAPYLPSTIPGNYLDLPIKQGDAININFSYIPSHPSSFNCNGGLGYRFDKTFYSTNNYTNFKSWWDGDSIGSLINSGRYSTYVITSQPNTFQVGVNYNPTLLLSPCNFYSNAYNDQNLLQPPSTNNMFFQFCWDNITNKYTLIIQGFQSCSGFFSDTLYTLSCSIKVTAGANQIIFETRPIDTAPDIFYENSLSFPIDSSGNHLLNPSYPLNDISQDITNGVNGYFNTGFFNCYTFFNGAESYRIQDSATTHYFSLGNRVTAVAAQDYMEIDRYADITYSGIYNQETNVNRLNAFNLGLINYKSLEYSFGEVFILDGRETDVRVLQEDKISYVLAGKNLLSDSAGGGAVSSVPEVLGTQIARIENYGISFNPESYTKWGADTFFTDVKRGAVIQLKGDSYSNEQLAVVSEFGMRTWFRDEFINSFNNQKLGAFDPYMNEYVLSSNDRRLPYSVNCIRCGQTQNFNLLNPNPPFPLYTYQFCVDVGSLIGNVSIEINTNQSACNASYIDVVYDGNTTSNIIPPTGGSLTFDFFKGNLLVETAIVNITIDQFIDFDITVNCPVSQPLTIIEVVYTDAQNTGESIHIDYAWHSGAYTSPLQVRSVTFGSPTLLPYASWFNEINGYEGNGSFPYEGTTMRLYSDKWATDTFVFDSNVNNFKYLRTATVYNNDPAGLNALYQNAFLASPIVTMNSNVQYADFITPPTVDGDRLYLIWDLRNRERLLLCYDDAEPQIPCCNCEPCTAQCVMLRIVNNSNNDAVVQFPSGSCKLPYEGFYLELRPEEVAELCVINDNSWYVSSGSVDISLVECDCTDDCDSICKTKTFINNNNNCLITYTNCDGNNYTIDVPPYFNVDLCMLRSAADPILICPIGSGGSFVDTLFCGCCDANNNNQNNPYSCRTYRVTVSGQVNINYTDCNGVNINLTGYDRQTYDLCVQRIELDVNGWHSGCYQPIITPMVSGSEASISILYPCLCSN